MKGRPSKPSSLKALQGNAGHRAKRDLAGKEPAPPVGAPEPPEHLDDRARRKWYERVGIMMKVAGWLTLFDGDVLAAYCSAWSRWEEAEIELPRLRREMAKAKRAQRGQYLAEINSLVGQHRNALREMRYFGNELGWSAASRTRIRINDGQMVLGLGVNEPAAPAAASPFESAARLAGA